MKNKAHLSAAILVAICLVACSSPSTRADPYPGSGGLFLGTPRAEDVRSGRSVFDVARFASFKVGTTSKQDVVKVLGPPAWWKSNPDSTSAMGYDFVRKESFLGMQKIERATFTFDSNLLLSKAEYPSK
jgi:hypothetical protein